MDRLNRCERLRQVSTASSADWDDDSELLEERIRETVRKLQHPHGDPFYHHEQEAADFAEIHNHHNANSSPERMSFAPWSAQEVNKPWTCAVCTFENEPLFLSCGACGQVRNNGVGKTSSTEATSPSTSTTTTITPTSVAQQWAAAAPFGTHSGGDNNDHILEALREERRREVMRLQERILLEASLNNSAAKNHLADDYVLASSGTTKASICDKLHRKGSSDREYSMHNLSIREGDSDGGYTEDTPEEREMRKVIAMATSRNTQEEQQAVLSGNRNAYQEPTIATRAERSRSPVPNQNQLRQYYANNTTTPGSLRPGAMSVMSPNRQRPRVLEEEDRVSTEEERETRKILQATAASAQCTPGAVSVTPPSSTSATISSTRHNNYNIDVIDDDDAQSAEEFLDEETREIRKILQERATVTNSRRQGVTVATKPSEQRHTTPRSPNRSPLRQTQQEQDYLDSDILDKIVARSQKDRRGNRTSPGSSPNRGPPLPGAYQAKPGAANVRRMSPLRNKATVQQQKQHQSLQQKSRSLSPAANHSPRTPAGGPHIPTRQNESPRTDSPKKSGLAGIDARLATLSPPLSTPKDVKPKGRSSPLKLIKIFKPGNKL